VNNITSDVDLDFKTMRDAFRAIDTTNSGTITIDQIKKGFVHDNYVTYLDNVEIEKIFSRFDFNKNGEINYSEFMAATVDKKKALTKANL
jgi:Ca2+-binding EF-hand superfamily protein